MVVTKYVNIHTVIVGCLRSNISIKKVVPIYTNNPCLVT
jgi:hypothetical protein